MTTLTFHLIFHTHWDREWYRSRAAFHGRLIGMMDGLLDQLAREEGLSFLLDGQTVILEDYLQARPERAEEIRLLTRAGRLQVGPWYVLADELIPGGESLVRNLLLGGSDAARWGRRLETLYSPDAFGHPACWPDLARGVGIASGVVWRGLGGATGQEGDRYRWRAPSGATVDLWHLPPTGYEIGVELAGDPERLAEAWAWVRGQLVGRARGRDVPVFIGADHHGPPALYAATRMVEQLAELERPNEVRVSRLDEFFEAARREFRDAPLLSGALVAPGSTWVLQGTHATRTPLKRRAAEVELWLTRFAEPLAALARHRGGIDRRPVLERAWRLLVQSQFHDTICGTTSDAVAREAGLRLDAAQAYANDAARSAAFELVGHDPDRARERPDVQSPRLVVWNPVPHPRGGVMLADVTFFRRDVLIGPPGARARTGPGARPFSLRTPDGRAVPMQVLARRRAQERLDATRHYPDQDEVDCLRVALRLPSVPGLGCTALVPGAAHEARVEDTAEVQARSLVNRSVVVTLDPTGALMLYDRRSGTRWLDLLRLESQGDAGDAYTFSPAARIRGTRSMGPITVRRRAAGPLVAALEARWRMRAGTQPGGRVGVRLVVMVHADSPVVRCILDLDNSARDHRLRARVATGLPGAAARVGTAFGDESRPAGPPPRPAQALEAAVATAAAQRFVSVTESGRGLAVLAPGFFEYEHTPTGDLLVTLLRAIGALSRNDLPQRPGHAAWPTSIPEAQCLGTSRVELALAPLIAGDRIPALWESVFTPLRGLWIRDAIDAPAMPGAITLEGAGLVYSALKPAEGEPRSGAAVLRCYNPEPQPVAGAWRFDPPVRAAFRTRLDEAEPVPLVLEDGGRVARFTASPGEIVTVLVH
jgi:2-O-(6-phospho-alpha-D-mannosyl)-D-glycerate hydrolase